MKTNKEKISEISARIETIIECCATVPNNFAKVLGYTRAQTIYDILARKCAPSYDFFNRFTDSEYSAIINLRWLLNGEGEMWTDLMRRLSHDDQIEIVDRVNHGVLISEFQVRESAENRLMDLALAEKGFSSQQYNYIKGQLAKVQTENGKLQERAANADKYYDTVMEQAKEIGRLEQRIADLEQRLEKSAGSVNTGDTANVG